MKTLHSLLLHIFVLTLLVVDVQADVSRTSGLIAEKTKWENRYYIVNSSVEGPTLLTAAITDPDRKIVKRSKGGPINGGLVRAAIERLGARGFCFETTYQKQLISTRTRQHRVMVHRLMCELGMVGPDGVNVIASATEVARIRVAVYDAGGTGGSGAEKLERILESKPTFLLTRDTLPLSAKR